MADGSPTTQSDTKTLDLLSRLRRRYLAPGAELVNDDGPEAAAEIERLQKRVAELEGDVERLEDALDCAGERLAGDDI